VPAATIERVFDPLLTHGRLPQAISASPCRACARRWTGPASTACWSRRWRPTAPPRAAACWSATSSSTLAGQPASSLDALRSHLQVGATVQAVIVRGGQRQELAIDVIQRPSSFCG
jgi:hypothetical protein